MSDASILIRIDNIVPLDFTLVPSLSSLERQTLQTVMPGDFVPINPTGKTTSKTTTTSKIIDETIDQKYKVNTENPETEIETKNN